MLSDNIKNIKKYTDGKDLVSKAMSVIEKTDLEAIDVGKYYVDGENLFYMIQQYDSHTWEDGKFETHDHHIDIQLVIKGEEIISFEERKLLKESIPHNEIKDVTFYDNSVRGKDYILRSGDFMILYPEDGHKPGNCIDKPSPVKKLVFKVIC